jgi:ubiquinone/menaquinone biosynthesis C-methylase UbiE
MINKKEYSKMYEVEETHWWYKGLRYYLFYWINKYQPNKILDAGCGTGINASYLKNSGYDIAGIDFSVDSISYSKKRGLENIIQGEIQKLPYGHESFDLIYCMDVIGILNDKDADSAVKEAHRCLTPGGIYIINAAALNYLFSAQDYAWHIKKRYSKNEIVNLLERNNFSIKKVTYRVFLLFPLVLISKYINKNNKESDTDKTNFLLNFIFTPIMYFEFLISKYFNLPIGSSIFVVAKKI